MKKQTFCLILMTLALFFQVTNLSSKDDVIEKWKIATPLPAHRPTQGYPIEVIKLYDADTITNCTINVGHGFNVFLGKQTIRFSRIQAPEIGSRAKTDEEKKAGEAARKRCQELIDGATNILFVPEWKTKGVNKGDYKTEGRGRWLGEIYIDGKNLIDQLVKEGHAKLHKY